MMEDIMGYVQDHKVELGVATISTLLFHFYKVYKSTNQNCQQNKLRKQLVHLRARKFKEIKKKYQYTIPAEILNSDNTLIDEVQYLDGSICRIQRVPHLISELRLKQLPNIKSPLLKAMQRENLLQRGGFLPQESFVYKGSYVLSKNTYAKSQQLKQPIQWLLAGPRKFLYFKPSNVKAAIVTCGGLCPGLNVVIREIFINLNIHYGCPEVWGIHFGYQGLYNDEWKLLTLDDVKNLQFQGGTQLGSSRGGFQLDLMIEALLKKGINQLYVIGGDGTHRGIHVLHEEIKKRQLQISIIGVPKTIDNDIPIIDKSFGFETSVSESLRAIRSAYVESTGVPYGIGLVRLMGRDAGHIAMDATYASRDVDICLIPQAKLNIQGKYGLLEYIYQELMRKKHLVIVVAEGAGKGVLDLEKLSKGVEKDTSGNIKLPNIGEFLKTQIIQFCKKKELKATLKYIDPTYMIRTVPANTHDVRMCSHLAACAVHGAMAGFTGFTCGHINNTPAMIPVSALFGKQNLVDIEGRTWQRVLGYTQQPQFLAADQQLK